MNSPIPYPLHLLEPETASSRLPLAKRVRMVVAVSGLPILGAAGAVWLALADGLWAFDLVVLGVLYVVTMLGVELGMHRLFSHRQFEAAAPVRALLSIMGAMAGQGSPLLWAAFHRTHHRHSDGPGDPHSPVHGHDGSGSKLRRFLWAHFAWFCEQEGVLSFYGAFERQLAGHDPDGSPGSVLARRVRDWSRDPLVVAVDRLYPVWHLLGFAGPALLGLALYGPWGALHGLLWGGCMRHFLINQVVFGINTVGHTIGTKRYATDGESRNNAVLAALTLGAGWHNNHHAFPESAFVSLRWWHLDPTGWLLRALEALGLVWDVQRVDRARVLAARRR